MTQDSKQEPIAPKVAGSVVHFYVCGKCGNEIDMTFGWCPWCGQAIDWSKTNVKVRRIR